MSSQPSFSGTLAATLLGACALLAPGAHAEAQAVAATARHAASPPASAAGPSSPPMIDACPRELAVKQSVTAEVAGWTAVDPQESYPFTRIAFYKGPPGDDQRVVPSYENRTATGLHDGWMLRHQPAGYWVQCQYGNTAATVVRKLDDANDFCIADYDPRFATLVVKHWACFPNRARGSARAASGAASRVRGTPLPDPAP